MAKLQWDKIDERLYETGIDRGVLYLPDQEGEYSNGVAWNGLTSVEENFAGEGSNPHYFDGVKYLDSYNIGDYTAQLTAYTYPDEFLGFEGISELGDGLFADDQNAKQFGLSYRTVIGSELEGVDHGYKIHLLYNLTATEDPVTYQNGSESPEPIDFTWLISGVPETSAYKHRPTAHIILDSTQIREDLLAGLEEILYGTDDTNPRLPTLGQLLGLVLYWDPKLIVPDSVTGIADLVDGQGDLTEIRYPGIFYALPSTRLVATTVAGLYTLEVV
jgi:hypothetical protein